MMDIVLLIVGVIFAVLGAALVWNQLQALIYFSPVDGKVVALEKRITPATDTKKQGGPMYYPVIEYIGSGNKKEFRGNTGSSRPTYEIGETVTVLYSRKKDEARLKSMVPILLGLFFVLTGVGLCYLFIQIFTFSYFSMAIYAIGGIFIVNSGRKALKKRDINSIDELKESFRNTQMKTRKGTEIEQPFRIYDPAELDRDIAKQSKGLKYAGPVFTALGILAITFAVYLGMERANFLETALKTDGKVIELIESRSDDSYVYYPRVEFSLTGTDRVISFRHESGSNPPSYKVGEKVQVLYDPENPHDAIIDGGLMNWLATGLVAGFGILFTFAGITSVKQWMKHKRVYKS
jgi:hypothetical protein